MALLKVPKGRVPGLFYPPNHTQVLFERAVTGTGQNCAEEVNNLDKRKLVTEPGQPSTTDTVNMHAGNGENTLYIW